MVSLYRTPQGPNDTSAPVSYTHLKNSVSQNVTTVNLINKKRIAKRRVNMQWFKGPPRIYFERCV